MKLIEYAKLNPTIGMRKIAEVFKCGRTQVQTILKAKESIISDFETNAPAPRKQSRNAQYQDVDGAVYVWYLLAREQLVPVTGPMLQEEALVIANGLGHSEFKASNVAVETRLRLGKRGLRHLDILLKIFGTRTRQAASFRHFLRDL